MSEEAIVAVFATTEFTVKQWAAMSPYKRRKVTGLTKKQRLEMTRLANLFFNTFTDGVLLSGNSKVRQGYLLANFNHDELDSLAEDIKMVRNQVIKVEINKIKTEQKKRDLAIKKLKKLLKSC